MGDAILLVVLDVVIGPELRPPTGTVRVASLTGGGRDGRASWRKWR